MVANVFYPYEGDPTDEAAWQAFVAEHRDPSAGEQTPVMTPATAVKKLSELFLLCVVVVAMVGAVLQQRSATQIAAQEVEIQRLHEQLATATAQQETPETAAGIGRRECKLSVLHILETEHLRFVVEPGSVGIVTANIFQIEHSYRQIREDLQLDPIAETGKLSVYVTNYADGRRTVPYDTLGVIDIDMSVCAQPPAEATNDATTSFPADLLRRLARRALHEAVRTRIIKAKWDIIVESLYRHVADDQQRYPSATLKPYEIKSRHLAQISPLTMVERTDETGNWMYPDTTAANAVADALIEYIFAAYGRGSVPQLLDALSKYDSFEQVIPAVFAIPADQFTTEWHAYLRLHYPTESVGSTGIHDLEPSRSH